MQDCGGISAYTSAAQCSFCSPHKKGVYKAARVNVHCPWDKFCYTGGSALQPSKHAWESLDHPGDNLNRNFQAHSKFLPSDTKQRLKTAAAFLAVVLCFIALGFWTLGLGKSSASITVPHLPTARKIFCSNVPTLCTVYLGDLVTSLFLVQRHRWEALLLWIFSPNGFIQVLFTVFRLSLFLGYLLKHHQRAEE